MHGMSGAYPGAPDEVRQALKEEPLHPEGTVRKAMQLLRGSIRCLHRVLGGLHNAHTQGV